jgi:hypothetical protein
VPDPLAGQTIRATETAVGWMPGTILARGNRTSNKASITTEVGVLRIDGITIVAGRRYMVICNSSRVDSATSTDKFQHRIRVSEAGAATTSSTEVSYWESADQDSGMPMGFFTATTNSTTCSVLFTLARFGAGSSTWQATDHDGGFCLEVFDCGEDPGDTGIDV